MYKNRVITYSVQITLCGACSIMCCVNSPVVTKLNSIHKAFTWFARISRVACCVLCEWGLCVRQRRTGAGQGSLDPLFWKMFWEFRRHLLLCGRLVTFPILWNSEENYSRTYVWCFLFLQWWKRQKPSDHTNVTSRHHHNQCARMLKQSESTWNLAGQMALPTFQILSSFRDQSALTRSVLHVDPNSFASASLASNPWVAFSLNENFTHAAAQDLLSSCWAQWCHSSSQTLWLRTFLPTER